MKYSIHLVIEEDESPPEHIPLTTIERECEQLTDVGLHLAEAKSLLSNLQAHMVRGQLAAYLRRRRSCPHYGKARTVKGYHSARFRSAFGDVDLRCPRWHRCVCEAIEDGKTFSPHLEPLTSHTSPELEYLQARWAAHVSFEVVTRLLKDGLPIDAQLSAITVRGHIQATAQRLEDDLGIEQYRFDGGSQQEIENSPEPEGPVTVGLDGGYVRGRDKKPGANGCFEVIAGKSLPTDGPSKVFALVGRHDDKPKRRLHELLKAQGVVPRQRVVFMSDGGDTVRGLPRFLHPGSEHLLDWFHIAMRIEQLSQIARGMPGGGLSDKLSIVEAVHQLQRVKWFLWHGNVLGALDASDSLIDTIEGAQDDDREAGKPANLPARKLARGLTEFAGYINANAAAIPNYGERYRYGERISTGFVESTINQVVAKRFVKRQQMRWTPKGAHLLLQIRTAELNGDLPDIFQRWYPGFTVQIEESVAAA